MQPPRASRSSNDGEREPNRSAFAVRPFTSRSDYEGMVDYFLGGGEAFQRGMGIEPAKMPTREAWLAATLEDHERADEDKERFYVAWLASDEVVGHSSISHIEHGRSAHCHLHLWSSELRGTGAGPWFLARSIDLYFERFALRLVACEPYAENLAPNRALPKLGFRLVGRFRTVPTSTCFEQEVSRYEVTREEWFGRRDAARR